MADTTPGIRTRLEPEDEYTHPIEDASNFNESMYFNVFDRARRIGGWFRLANRPNEGRGEMSCCIYLPDGRIGFMFGRPARRDNEALAGAGMSFEVIEPFKHLKVRYDGKLCVMDHPKDMADPKNAFSRNPQLDAVLDLDYRGISPMFGGEAVNADGSKLALDAEKSFARGHTEQHVAAKGRITVGAETFEIDGLGLRDHSWGPRYWQAIHWYRWLPMNFSEDFAMMISVTTGADGGQRQGGMVLRDGEYLMIREARVVADYDADDCQTTLKAWARTDEREYEVTGKVLSLIPLRNRRRTPEGEELMTRITEGMTEYTCDGQVGYGLSEFLDQIVDDQPVGKVAGS